MVNKMALSLQFYFQNFNKKGLFEMGFTEIGVVLFLLALLAFGFMNSRKVSQELKKLETDK
ncbi:MAG: hypothetical protein MZV64_65175 [Ignavibacteriales bacterium]|nr:hypothetical protein [Ignavibacteriales bacterium]